VTAETLKLVPLFARLSDEQLAALANSVIASKFRRGAFVLRAGQDPDGLYVILSGRAKVFISDKEGGEVILATIGPGNYFGEMGLIGDRPRSASVQTLAPSELMFLSKADFLHYVAENPGLATCIMQGLVKRLQQADRQIESLALQDVVGRVSQLLLDLSEEVDGDLVIQKAPPKQEIAHMIGASREMVSRVMKSLKTSGHIQVHNRRIVLLEKAASNSQASSEIMGTRSTKGKALLH